MQPGVGPHLPEQAPHSPGLSTVSNLDYDGYATDTDSEKETLQKVFDNIVIFQHMHKHIIISH